MIPRLEKQHMDECHTPVAQLKRSRRPQNTYSNGQAIATPNNPYALTFDPSYVYASNQGIRGFIGFRYTIF